MRLEKTILSSKDLKVLGYSPGPVFREILQALLLERLDNQLQTREEEINFVRNKFPFSR